MKYILNPFFGFTNANIKNFLRDGLLIADEETLVFKKPWQRFNFRCFYQFFPNFILKLVPVNIQNARQTVSYLCAGVVCVKLFVGVIATAENPQRNVTTYWLPFNVEILKCKDRSKIRMDFFEVMAFTISTGKSILTGAWMREISIRFRSVPKVLQHIAALILLSFFQVAFRSFYKTAHKKPPEVNSEWNLVIKCPV